MLNLDRDICFFDLEATGLNVIRDRIMQVGAIKYFADGREPEELDMLINPGVLISEEAFKVHGIGPQDVANKPTFAQVAEKLHDFFGDADLGGYNCTRFDVPMLMEEFVRAGFEFDISKRRIVDMQRIFYKMEPRTLKAALKFYCKKDLVDAHDAMADVRATIDVLLGQLKMYEGVDHIDGDDNVTPAPIVNDMQALHDFTQDPKSLDVTNRLKMNDQNEIVFNFGKYTGQSVKQVLGRDRKYYHWIMDKEFSAQVKNIITKLMKEYDKERRNG